MPQSREDLQAALARQRWTAHNIRLADDVTTIPGAADFHETERRLHAIIRTLSVIYRSKLLTGLRVVDLGCLEGGFALALAQRGAAALGVEARRANVEKALLLKEHFGLANLDFIVGDVKEFTAQNFGVFDVVIALGILYHLDKPVQWLRQLSAATRGVLVVETHYAPETEIEFKMIDAGLRRSLGHLEAVTVDGRKWHGRSFTEYPPGSNPEDLLWSAYSNPSSFWLTKDSLLNSMLHAGFDLVFEQHDYTAPEYARFTKSWSRGMFVGLKTGAFAQSLGA